VRLLLDENLSPRLVPKLAQIGVYALHVAHLGRAGTSDPELFRLAYERDLVVVTINASDFITLARGVDLHPGLIVLRVSGLDVDEQWAHLEPVISSCVRDEAAGLSLVNTVVEIMGVNRYRRYDLPPPE
jgi:predicted nuclease of predicted toxin-antitoxin system